VIPHIFGLDFSIGMLQQAQANLGNRLANANALNLPFAAATFEYVQCLHAIHHFGNAERFLDEVWRVLKSGGTLAIIHLIRPIAPDNWYGYQYFEGTLETDMERYPAFGQLLDSLILRGAPQVSWQIVERFDNDWIGSDVFNDPFIQKDSTSQLTLLSDDVYEAGLETVRRVAEAEPDHIFQVRSHIGMLVASRP
jgi:SAM-dependent methyltransferase